MVPAWLLLLLDFSGRGFAMYLDDAYEVPEPGIHKQLRKFYYTL